VWLEHFVAPRRARLGLRRLAAGACAAFDQNEAECVFRTHFVTFSCL
jgi:hypothetical protein